MRTSNILGIVMAFWALYLNHFVKVFLSTGQFAGRSRPVGMFAHFLAVFSATAAPAPNMQNLYLLEFLLNFIRQNKIFNTKILAFVVIKR